MCPVTQREFAFEPKSLAELRRSLGFTQARLSQVLGVPTNTLSRWETGATTPDAATLAALHSLATEYGIEPRFFRRVAAEANVVSPTGMVFVWDLDSAGVAADQVVEVWSRMEWYLSRRFPTAVPGPTAAVGPIAAQGIKLLALSSRRTGSADQLEARGFRIAEPGGHSDAVSAGSALAARVRDAAGLGTGTVLVLAAASDSTAVIDDAEAAGAQVYVWSPEPRDRLAARAALGRLIRWHEPYLVLRYVEKVAELAGRRTSRARWGQMCRALAGANPQLGPESLGLRRRDGYWALLTRLAETGFVRLIADREDPRFFTVTVREGPTPAQPTR